MNSRYGQRIDESTVRFERILPGPIERVWQYLVDGRKRAKWLCDGDIPEKVGETTEMHFHNASLSSEADIERPEKYRDMPEKVSFTGRVTECEPKRKIAHTWKFDGENSEVVYELEDLGDTVRLVLTHRRLADSEDLLAVSGGWHTHLEILEAVLERRTPPAFWSMQVEFERDYRERYGL